MMKKSAMALAVATTLGVSPVGAAEFELSDGTFMSIYGDIQLKYNVTTNVEGEDEAALTDNGSTIGFGIDHAFDNGLTAFGIAEFEHRADEAKSIGGLNEGDQAFMGVRGDFGRIQAGSWDGIYADLIYDLVDPYESASPSAAARTDEGDQIAYFSPDLNGFSFALQARVRGEQDTGSEDQEVGTAAVIGYTGSDWGVTAGLDDRGGNDRTTASGDVVFDDGTTTGIGGYYDLGRFHLAGRVSLQDNADDSPAGDETGYYAVLGSFDYGPGNLYATAQEVEPDEGDSRSEAMAGASYAIGDGLYVFAEYGQYDRLQDEGDLTEVGAVYEF